MSGNVLHLPWVAFQGGGYRVLVVRDEETGAPRVEVERHGVDLLGDPSWRCVPRYGTLVERATYADTIARALIETIEDRHGRRFGGLSTIETPEVEQVDPSPRLPPPDACPCCAASWDAVPPDRARATVEGVEVEGWACPACGSFTAGVLDEARSGTNPCATCPAVAPGDNCDRCPADGRG